MVFGFFKKKNPPASAMDTLIRMTYGDSPPPKRANLSEAIRIAHTKLLFERVRLEEVTQVATGLFNGPMPYSTHDLAVATAMNLFRSADGERQQDLEEAQIGARLEVLEWIKERRVAPLIAKSFEDTLYKMFKQPVSAPPPSAQKSTPTTQAPSLHEAVVSYFKASVEKADEIFAASWKFDPEWVGLLSVAADLDKIAGNSAKKDAIHEKVLDCFQNGKTSDYCGAILTTVHVTNQRELEDMMRQSRRR